MRPFGLLLQFACVLALCTPARADRTFSGSLERISRQSITIRQPNALLIDAHLPDDPNFASIALLKTFRLGDQVKIACKPIAAIFDVDSQLRLVLEVLDLR